MGNLDKIITGFGLIVFGFAIMIGVTPIDLTGPPAVLLGCIVVVIGGGIVGKYLKKTAK